MAVPYYSDDLVTLYHGDCLMVDEWLSADVLVTDPPYGVHRTKFSRTGMNGPAYAGEELKGRASDRTLGPEHVALRDGALALWGTKPGFAFGSWRAPRPANTRLRLIWDRMFLGNGGVMPWRPCDEEIYLLGDWPNPRNGKWTASHSSVIRVRGYSPNDSHRPDHPSPKPTGLMEKLIQSCPPGVIADPFAGSGSTLVAAKTLGRQCVGVELEERYCELIATRLTQGALDFSAA